MAKNMEKSHDGVGSFRYERKFQVPKNCSELILNIISMNRFDFREIYQLRTINNIYLDTKDFLFFRQNVEGLSERKKIRIRWYGKLYGQIRPKLEFKNKYSLVSTKNIFEIPNIFLSKELTIKKINSQLNFQKLPLDIQNNLKGLNLSLLNSYKRRYFLSKDENFRITIDYDITYFDLSNCTLLKSAHKINEHSMILELKYNKDWEKKANEITNQFPFRLSKYSKYISGIECFGKSIS